MRNFIKILNRCLDGSIVLCYYDIVLVLICGHGFVRIVSGRNECHGKMLEKIGADKVIYPERDMGKRVAHNLASSNIMDYIELTDDLSLMQMLLIKCS